MKTVKIAPIHLSSLDIPEFRFYHSMKNFCTACVLYPHNFHLMNAMGMLHFLLHCVGPMSGERVRGRWDTETSPLRPLVGLSFDDLTDKLQDFGLTFGERGWCKIRILIHINIETKHTSPNRLLARISKSPHGLSENSFAVGPVTRSPPPASAAAANPARFMSRKKSRFSPFHSCRRSIGSASPDSRAAR